MIEHIKPKAQPDMLPVKLLKGYWPEGGGKKHKRGEVVELPAAEARKAVKAGIAERGDAF